jgi:hypothetical protein
MPLYAPKNRKDTRRLIQFKKHHLERIAELNAIDIEVYRLAEERFIRTLNSEAFDRAKLKRFQIVNKPASLAIRGVKRVVRLARHCTGSTRGVKK